MSTDAASENAAEAALHKSTVELWLLYTIGVILTILRTYTRVKVGGLRHLRAEDFLVWAGIVCGSHLTLCNLYVSHDVANIQSEQIFYTAQTALAYSVGNVAHGLANNGLSDAQRATLSHDSPEYQLRCVHRLRVFYTTTRMTHSH